MTNPIVNKAGIGLLSGLVAGLVAGGIGSRVVMRIVAIAAGIPPSFSIGGTLNLLIMGAMMGAIFGLLYGVAKQLLPVPGLWKGLVFGVLLLVIFVVPPFLGEPEGELALVSPLVGLSLFAPLPLAYGLLLGTAAHWLERRWSPESDLPMDAVLIRFLGLVLLAFVGLYGLIVFGVAIVESP